MSSAIHQQTLLRRAFVAFGLLASSAHAADYTLRVEAPAECADEARLLEAVRVRSPGFTPADWETPGATRFVVRVLPQATGVSVELETTDSNGASSLRRVPAQDCAEAIRASAWIVTLLVDPTAAAASENVPLETPSVNETSQAIVAPMAPPEIPPASQAVTAPSPAPAAAAVPQVDTPENVDSASKPRPWHIRLGAFGGVLQTALPETPFGFGVFIEWAWERDSWLRPSARLAGLDAGSGLSSTDRGDVEISFQGARLSLCPLRTSRASVASARFCALGELGRLWGNGQSTENEASATPTWYAVGSAIGLELQPWSFLALELEAAVLFPLNRDRFVFEPDPVQVAYEVPPISWSVALGGGWSF